MKQEEAPMAVMLEAAFTVDDKAFLEIDRLIGNGVWLFCKIYLERIRGTTWLLEREKGKKSSGKKLRSLKDRIQKCAFLGSPLRKTERAFFLLF
jgi:hypothetical protein